MNSCRYGGEVILLIELHGILYDILILPSTFQKISFNFVRRAEMIIVWLMPL